MNVKLWCRKLFPHVSIVSAGMMIVFFCIDRVNKPIGFMTNEFHKWLSLLLALTVLGYAVNMIARIRREEREAYRRRVKAMQAGQAGKPMRGRQRN